MGVRLDKTKKPTVPGMTSVLSEALLDYCIENIECEDKGTANLNHAYEVVKRASTNLQEGVFQLSPFDLSKNSLEGAIECLLGEIEEVYRIDPYYGYEDDPCWNILEPFSFDKTGSSVEITDKNFEKKLRIAYVNAVSTWRFVTTIVGVMALYANEFSLMQR